MIHIIFIVYTLVVGSLVIRDGIKFQNRTHSETCDEIITNLLLTDKLVVIEINDQKEMDYLCRKDVTGILRWDDGRIVHAWEHIRGCFIAQSDEIATIYFDGSDENYNHEMNHARDHFCK